MIPHYKFPKTLFRLQNSLRFKMKQKQQTLLKGKNNYDYLANQHNIYVPRKLQIQTPKLFQPNGLLLFSMSQHFKDIFRTSLKGSLRYYYVIQIPQGTPLPENTVLLQDPVQQFSYWLQTQVPTQIKQFNSKIELLLLGNKIHRKKQFKPLIVSEIMKKPVTNQNNITQTVQDQSQNVSQSNSSSNNQ